MSNDRFSSKYFFNPPSHHPANQDALGYKDYARSICEVICNLQGENNGVTIGIFGDWGTGKTTVLHMIAGMLPQQKDKKNHKGKFLVVKFSAWHYVKQEELWLAMLRRIKLVIEEKLGLLELLKVNYKLWKSRLNRNPFFWVSWIRALVIVTLVTTILLIGIPLFSEFKTIVENRISEDLLADWGPLGTLISYGGKLGVYTAALLLFWTAIGKLVWDVLKDKINVTLPRFSVEGFDRKQSIDIDEFRSDFNAIFSAISRTTVVVLVDDLDRCPPDQVIPVLEAIKRFGVENFLNQEESNQSEVQFYGRIVFVLAADRRAIEKAVYGYFRGYREQMNEAEADEFVHQYVEKIIQIPFSLPPLTRTQLGKLFDDQKDMIPGEKA